MLGGGDDCGGMVVTMMEILGDGENRWAFSMGESRESGEEVFMGFFSAGISQFFLVLLH